MTTGASPLAALRAASLAAAVAGALALVAGIVTGRGEAAFAALDASWLFFAGLAAGAVAVAAAVRVAHGTWARAALPIAERAARFFPVAFALLVLLLLGARSLLAWTRGAPPSGLAGLALRQLLSAALVFGLGTRLVRSARALDGADPRLRARSVAYVLGFVAGLSFWAYDFVIALTDAPPYAVLPPYYFLGAFLSGLAWVALVSALADVDGPDLRHDLGKLLFAFIVVWTYLLWALFLPTWYGNVPEESAQLLRRGSGPYRAVSATVLGAVFAWPFWLLFSERFKRRRATLAAGAGTILLGLWAERFLLVLPSLALRADAASLLVGAGVSVGVAGLFLLAATPVGAPEPGRPG
jgi:Ni/Fe-hydrogenase subunit HybB-like protein